jgi:hypothetical protein
MRHGNGIGTVKHGIFLAAMPLLAVGIAVGFILGMQSDSKGADKEDLDFYEFQALARVNHRLDKVVMLEPPGGEVGMYMIVGDRFGVVHAYHLTHSSSERVWLSKHLDGVIREIQVADLSGDGYHDIFMARTSTGMLYVWSGTTFDLRFESLPTDYKHITAFTTGDVDAGEYAEIVVNADKKIYFLDGKNFKRKWTSLLEYEATRMLCGDVDGDNNMEIVLNTGQIVDTFTGDVKWEEEGFFDRIELLDMDGDGIPEILTEGNGTSLKIYDMDHGIEKRL